MRRRSPITFLIVPLFLAFIEGAAYYGWGHILSDLCHYTLLKLFRILYTIETASILAVMIFVMGSFARRFNLRRTYYGFRGAGIIMSDIIPKLFFTIFVLLYGIIQGVYVGLNHFFAFSTNQRLNIDWLLIGGTVIAFTLFVFIVRGIMIGRFDFKVLKETIEFDTLPDAF